MLNIPQDRLALLDSATLNSGAHADGEQTCARELLHLVVTGRHADETPECLTAALSAIPPLNDGPWRDDEHRTEAIRPWLRALLHCERDVETDQQIAYRLADFAVREIAPGALNAAGLGEEASRLRALRPVTDRDSAELAASAVRAVAGARTDAAADAAWAAAWATARAAADAAWAAAWATARAAADAAAAALLERWTNRILGIICEEYGVKGPTEKETEQ